MRRTLLSLLLVIPAKAQALFNSVRWSTQRLSLVCVGTPKTKSLGSCPRGMFNSRLAGHDNLGICGIVELQS